MLFFILGLAISVVCAVHVHRTRQEQFWMWIVLLLPMAGSLAYVFAVVLPAWRAQRASGAASTTLNPAEQVAAARARADQAPTVDNRLRLADCLMAADLPREAASIYRGELVGAFEHDPQILNRLAQAEAACGDSAAALATLDVLRASGATLSRESELARARALAGSGRHEEAIAAFRALLPHYPGEDARGHFANLLLALGRQADAREVLMEMVARGRHAPPHLQAHDAAIYTWAHRTLEGLKETPR